ncbi:receptor-like protein kinase FERONIA [Bidens hawaiensis]|uniref:receptor-like protein kinase FERONIA n=1 Tax=Bidens hawaiensis TaxID=980011 RepID=UPI004049D081
MAVIIKKLEETLKLQGETLVLWRFRLSDIVLATENFAKTYCIGSDTNCKVYRAELGHFGNNNSLATEGENDDEPSKKRITVAIKCITERKRKQGKQTFLAELEMRACYKHPNVASLLGFCDEGDKMILVYEHASEGTLEDCLKSVDSMNNLTWNHRLCMCLEIARGLHHLHNKMDDLHGVINSANILLDKRWEAKIAYFGISSPTNQDVGMKVYWDPEPEMASESETETEIYWDAESTLKDPLGRISDIYSFGVVLFEIFCGRLAYDPVYIRLNDKGLAPIARQCYNDGAIARIIDPRLRVETPEDIFTSNRGPTRDSLETVLKIGYQCLEEAAKRPTIEIVIKELELALNFHENFLKNLQVSLKDIESATENFSEKNCIGSSRFWKVYKGEHSFPQDNANNASVSGFTTITAVG